MHACLEIQTLTELSPIWQWVYMRTLTQRSFSPSFPVIGNTLGAPRLLTHSGYGKSWAVDLGNGSLRVYVSTCLRVYVSTYVSICGSRSFMILLWNLLVSPRRLWVSSLFELSTGTQMLCRPDKHRAKTQHRQRALSILTTAKQGAGNDSLTSDMATWHCLRNRDSQWIAMNKSMNCYELVWITVYSISLVWNRMNSS